MVTTAFGGGGTFASGALHGRACAAGASPVAMLIGSKSPTAAVAASETGNKRGIADMSHLPRGEAPQLTLAID
ncbi:hypothetical protein MBOU_46960 [Mycobacterium bourgelatii]|uniref:Uncharacterized protein n=1 Tax=Mycobacterium bourgelatii TaxID=1273442 RepID=A0A7I9YVC1_MYCBU|nr:hypothetical protein MBOU_46960 [Mycobacterium bourgelatii]